MKLITFIILFGILAIVCINQKNEDNKNITWYEKETIRNIEKVSNKEYRIEVGISAQFFYIDNKIDNFGNVLNVLIYSFDNKEYIKIGIENNTNRILYADKLR